jgi:hypothetical protein
MPKYSGIRVELDPTLDDPGYQYIPGSGFICRPDKIQELGKKLNAANVEGDPPATDEQIQELIRSPLCEEPN